MATGFRLDHVGIATHDPADAPLASWLGVNLARSKLMPSGVNVVDFGPAGGLELIWPSRHGTPIERFLERRGPGLHHLALAVHEPLEAVLSGLLEQGFAPTGEIEPDSRGRPSIFLHPTSTGGVLLELVEER